MADTEAGTVVKAVTAANTDAMTDAEALADVAVDFEGCVVIDTDGVGGDEWVSDGEVLGDVDVSTELEVDGSVESDGSGLFEAVADVDSDGDRGADCEGDTRGDEDDEATNGTGEVLFVGEIDGDGVVDGMALHSCCRIAIT